MPRSQVLIVDDDESIRTLLCLVLSEEGYEVVTATDGEAALAELRRPGAPAPALILLDLNMPRLDGGAFLTAYGGLAGPHAPVILLSGTRDDAASGAVEGGAGMVVSELPKPFDLDELLDQVARFVGRGGCAP
jgi:DNA-binding response OmpR family regulator